MSFGFDSSILLAAKQPERDPNETMRSFADLAQMPLRNAALDAQTQMHRATLADMLYKQNQQRSLASLVSQNAGQFQDPLARAYAQVGDGQGAADMAQAAIRRQEMMDRAIQLRGEILRSRASAVKTAADADKWAASLPADTRSAYGLDWAPDAKDEDKLAAVKNFIASGVAPVDRPKYDEAVRRQNDEANPNSVTSKLRVAAEKQFGGPELPDGTPGNAIDDKELDLLEKSQAAKIRAETARVMMGLGAGAGQVDLSSVPGWVKTAATTYHTEGKLPAFKDPGGYLHKQIMQVSDLMYPNDNISANRAAFDANKADIEEATKQAGATDVNEEKALGDIQVFKAKTGKVFNSNSPWLNAIGRKLEENAGNPEVAGFLAARTALVNGVNRVLASGNLSDSSRKEAEELLKKDASINQINDVLDVLQQDMARSKAAMHQRVSNAQARISGKPAPSDDQGPAVMDPAKVSARIAELVKSGVTDRESIKKTLRAEGLAP